MNFKIIFSFVFVLFSIHIFAQSKKVEPNSPLTFIILPSENEMEATAMTTAELNKAWDCATPFLEDVAQRGWEEGVEAIKAVVDPEWKDQSKQYLKNEIYNRLRNDYHLIEFQDGDDLFLHASNKPGNNGNGVLPIIPGKNLKERGYDPLLSMIFFELPKGMAISKRADFDIMKAYDLNPNDLSVKSVIPAKILQTIKKSPASSKRFFGIALAIRNNEYKFYPGQIFGPVVREVKNGQPMGAKSYNASQSPTNGGTIINFDPYIMTEIAAQWMASIRNGDQKTFNSLMGITSPGDVPALKLKTLDDYPEYHSSGLKKHAIVALNLSSKKSKILEKSGSVLADDIVVNASDNIVIIIQYFLPKGLKVTNPRIPTDIMFETLYGEKSRLVEQHLETSSEFITVLLHKEKGSNNFNIGMPPSLK
ncbi:MAG: hypothetical protein AAF502_13175 [Bacteroidota bacterium]